MVPYDENQHCLELIEASGVEGVSLLTRWLLWTGGSRATDFTIGSKSGADVWLQPQLIRVRGEHLDFSDVRIFQRCGFLDAWKLFLCIFQDFSFLLEEHQFQVKQNPLGLHPVLALPGPASLVGCSAVPLP